MRLGVISDTHGHIQYTAEAIRVLENEQVDVVIHCGDIGLPQIVALFAGRPTHFVFGNVDQDLADLRMAIEEGAMTCHERQGVIEVGGRRIGFLHGDDTSALMQMINSQEFDLVCYGHTHEKELHQDRQTWVLNPGAIYRASPHTLAVVELETMEIRHVVVEQPEAA
jgi:putative phosphoesterase